MKKKNLFFRAENVYLSSALRATHLLWSVFRIENHIYVRLLKTFITS